MPNTHIEDDDKEFDQKMIDKHTNCITKHQKKWEKKKDGSQVKEVVCRECNPKKDVQSKDN